jgi:DNA-binding MarR family transcriptional regulator
MARVEEERDRELTLGVRAIAIVSRQFERVCQEAGLSLPQYRLLLYVRVRPQRASELADRASVKRPTLTALVDGLADAGLIRRLSVEGDRRGIRLQLTDEGRERLLKVEDLLCSKLAHFASLGDESRVLAGLSDLAHGIEAEIDRRQP